MQVERSAQVAPFGVKPGGLSGERVSNTWVTCPQVRHNSGKPLLIPHVLPPLVEVVKTFGRLGMGPRPISLLVG